MFAAMDRHDDWAVIVALVGGGQEINTGEAGLAEWGRALEENYPHWKIAISPELLEGSPATASTQLFSEVPANLEANITVEGNLHLSVSQRAFRTTRLNSWVEAVLNGDSTEAQSIASGLGNYPLAITRDLETAREWLRRHARGLRKAGLVAPSGARRLRPHGINVSEQIEAADWFLKDKSDVRSSDYLELVATEFDIQGLELDWIGLCWGADMRREHGTWAYWQFRGSKWQTTRSEDPRRYAMNRYRVLLTRGREGLIVWIPEGDPGDPTRSPEYYDETYEYLVSCGLVPQ